MLVSFQKHLLRKCIFLLPMFYATVSLAQAPPDTISLTVPQAEKMFLDKNLSLLAVQYNVDAAASLVQQAKAWDNPILVTDQNLYDGKFFRHDKVGTQQYGHVYVQLQQLVRTAGKIKKQTQLAKDNVQSAEAQMADLLRNLKLVLITDLNNLSQLQATQAVLKIETETVQALSKGMEEMLRVGNVSQKDNLRIKALLFSLQTDAADNLRQQYDLQKELATLLQLKNAAWIRASGSGALNEAVVKSLRLEVLKDSALLLRPDLALQQSGMLYGQHNVALQKALATPDLTVGLEYDKLNSYVHNYYGLNLSLPLPLFNRNRGNIAAAQLNYKQAQIRTQAIKIAVGNEVLDAYQKLLSATALLNKENSALTGNYETLLANMVASYKQRQVNLYELVDFFQAYKETRVRQEQLVTAQRNAAAELDFAVAQNIVSL